MRAVTPPTPEPATPPVTDQRPLSEVLRKDAERGTESVGVAANSAVVTGSLLVIIVDLVAVQITDLL